MRKNEFWANGVDDYWDGVFENPYAPGTAAHSSWRAGWDSARESHLILEWGK